jgi:hypothetical protein
MSVSILVPVLVRSGSSSEIMFADFSDSALYLSSGELAPEQVSAEVFSEMDAQNESSAPEVPYGQINEVMRTERNLSRDNAKHIFRRGF